MRFILSFIFFGLLFYAIWIYFPDAFQTLVGWASRIFEFLKDLGERLVDRFQTHDTSNPPVPKALWFF